MFILFYNGEQTVTYLAAPEKKHAVLELGSDMLTVTFIHFTSNTQIIQENGEQTCEPLDRNFDLMLDAPNSYDGDFG